MSVHPGFPCRTRHAAAGAAEGVLVPSTSRVEKDFTTYGADDGFQRANQFAMFEALPSLIYAHAKSKLLEMGKHYHRIALYGAVSTRVGWSGSTISRMWT